MLNFAKTDKKLRFHVSDILSVISHIALSDVSNPPLDDNNIPVSFRETTMDGVIELVEYMTKENVTRRENPQSNASQFDGVGFLTLFKRCERELKSVFPQLEKLEVPKFGSASSGGEEVTRKYNSWVEEQIKDLGIDEYLEVPRIDKGKHAEQIEKFKGLAQNYRNN